MKCEWKRFQLLFKSEHLLNWFKWSQVNGSLAVSRALGDYEYKANSERGPCEQLVSPEPEVTALEKSDRDEFAVLACDGVWDVMSNEEVTTSVCILFYRLNSIHDLFDRWTFIEQKIVFFS